MGRVKRRNGTKTSSFGTSSRENHDSSLFYAGKMYEEFDINKKIEYLENKIDINDLNKIYEKSSEDMKELPDNSIHLMVTSPPYNVGKEYDENLTLEEYLGLLNRVWGEVHRVLVPGGRACINIANVGRKPYLPLNAFITQSMINLGFIMRGEIIWNKSSSAGTSTAWGSWQSSSNPTLRDVHEYIMVFSKDTLRRPNGDDKVDTITKEEFLEYTKSIWEFQAASARKIGHPAPFPIELPYRLIQLFTYENDIVLDPFMGSGQTALAALDCNRFFIGYDTEKEYVELAEKRIQEKIIQLNSPKITDYN